MAFARDPLSVRYDATAENVLMRAIRASKANRGVLVWIASSRAELRRPDRGGRTAHERAFSRSAYYYVWRNPINMGQIPDWSLKLTWGEELKPSGGGRLARPVRVRVWPRAKGAEHARGLPRGRQWAMNDEIRSGGIGSPWRRFDEGPRGEEVRTTSYRQQLARDRRPR